MYCYFVTKYVLVMIYITDTMKYFWFYGIFFDATTYLFDVIAYFVDLINKQYYLRECKHSYTIVGLYRKLKCLADK